MRKERNCNSEESQVQSGDDMVGRWWGWCTLGDSPGENNDGDNEGLEQQRRGQRYRFLE